MKIEYLTLENNEPAVQLRASDPSSNDAILAYLQNIAEVGCPEQYATEVLRMFARFKQWQEEHREGGPTIREAPITILRSRITVWLEQHDGFASRSEMSRRYHLGSDCFDQVIAPLELREFRVETSGRPTTFYVLPDAVELFQQHAKDREWTFFEVKNDGVNSHFEK